MPITVMGNSTGKGTYESVCPPHFQAQEILVLQRFLRTGSHTSIISDLVFKKELSNAKTLGYYF